MRQITLLKPISALFLILLLVVSLAVGLAACGRSAPVREGTEATAAAAESTAESPATEPVTTTLEPLPSAAEGMTPTVVITSAAGLSPTVPLTETEVVSGTLPPAPGVAELPAPGTPGMYAVVGVGPGEVLNVRQEAGTASTTVGQIPASATSVEVTGAGQEVDGVLWVPVRYKDLIGWVSSEYLAQQVGTAEAAVAARAMSIVNTLKSKDWKKLAKYAHPEKGVRFSPYGYVHADPNAEENDLVASPNKIPSLWKDTKVRKWGTFAGSGEPIEMTFRDYFKQFVYDVDFAQAAAIGFDERIGQSTTVENLDEIYPDAVVVEYHFPGSDPQYEGQDWRSLKLVLEPVNGNWFLVGIVHDQWTP